MILPEDTPGLKELIARNAAIDSKVECAPLTTRKDGLTNSRSFIRVQHFNVCPPLYRRTSLEGISQQAAAALNSSRNQPKEQESFGST